MDEELCASFIDCQKAFGHVNWTKLMQILKNTGTDCCERRLIRKLDKDQCVKSTIGPRRRKSVKIGRGNKTRMLFVTDSIQLIQ
jgi:hypothetical protein